jgi:hypothetical protein
MLRSERRLQSERLGRQAGRSTRRQQITEKQSLRPPLPSKRGQRITFGFKNTLRSKCATGVGIMRGVRWLQVIGAGAAAGRVGVFLQLLGTRDNHHY